MGAHLNFSVFTKEYNYVYYMWKWFRYLTGFSFSFFFFLVLSTYVKHVISRPVWLLHYCLMLNTIKQRNRLYGNFEHEVGCGFWMALESTISVVNHSRRRAEFLVEINHGLSQTAPVLFKLKCH